MLQWKFNEFLLQKMILVLKTQSYFSIKHPRITRFDMSSGAVGSHSPLASILH